MNQSFKVRSRYIYMKSSLLEDFLCEKLMNDHYESQSVSVLFKSKDTRGPRSSTLLLID